MFQRAYEEMQYAHKLLYFAACAKHQRRSPVLSKCQARLPVSTNEGHVPPSSSPSSRLRCLINAASARCLSSPAAAPASAAYCAVSGSTPLSVAALSLAISAVALSAAESAAAILLSAPPSPLTAGCPSAPPSLSCFGYGRVGGGSGGWVGEWVWGRGGRVVARS